MQREPSASFNVWRSFCRAILKIHDESTVLVLTGVLSGCSSNLWDNPRMYHYLPVV